MIKILSNRWSDLSMNPPEGCSQICDYNFAEGAGKVYELITS